MVRCSLTRKGRVRPELLVVLLLKVKWSRQYFHTFDQTYSIQREEEAGLKRAAIITIPGLVTSEQVHTTTSKLLS